MTESLAITVGDYFPVGDRMRRLTPRLAEATNAARHMGPLLSMIAHDCAARGEPSLASLVVSAATGEVGTGDSSWAPPQRLACWARWGEKWANG